MRWKGDGRKERVMTVKILVGDCREVLRTRPDESVQCCVTSPPYWGLREYGIPPVVWGGDPECVHEWQEKPVYRSIGGEREYDSYDHDVKRGPAPAFLASSFCSKCGAWLGSLGLEPTIDLYVAHIVEVFREVRRVLRHDGTLWLNMGDSYSQDTKWGGSSDSKNYISVKGGYQVCRNNRTNSGLKPKDLCMIPARVALALQADGWWLRSDIVWEKPNVTPESTTDRPTKSHEYVFLLATSGHYFYDQNAIREPQTGNAHSRGKGLTPKSAGIGYSRTIKANARFHQNCSANTEVPGGRNRRTVWSIPSAGFKGAHFATFPPALAELCIAAGTSERGACPTCGAPWERIVEPTAEYAEHLGKTWDDQGQDEAEGRGHFRMPDGRRAGQRPVKRNAPALTAEYITTGWRPTCEHYDEHYRALPRTRSARKRAQQDAAALWWPRAKRRPGGDDWPTSPCVVLDPFGGAGTTGLQADRMGRDATLIELNPEYARMAEERIRDDGGWWAQVESTAAAPEAVPARQQLVMNLCS
jgi:DNA modification methylase